MGKEAEAAVVAPIIYGGNAMHVTQEQFMIFTIFSYIALLHFI